MEYIIVAIVVVAVIYQVFFNKKESGKSTAIAITFFIPLFATCVLIFLIKTANPKTNTKEPLSVLLKFL